jgi:hypothetical protein
MHVAVRSVDGAIITAALTVQTVPCKIKQLDHTSRTEQSTDG